MNINFGLHSQRRKGDFKLMHYQSHIRCNIAYTPWPLAYCPPHVPLVTSATLHLLSVLLSHFQPNTDTGHLVLFSRLWVNLFSRWAVRLYCHNPYVSQLVNHLRTRTPMGDLVEQSRLALDSHYAYSI